MEPWKKGVSGIVLLIDDDEHKKAFAKCHKYIEGFPGYELNVDRVVRMGNYI
jgi:hypothetical protein